MLSNNQSNNKDERSKDIATHLPRLNLTAMMNMSAQDYQMTLAAYAEEDRKATKDSKKK
jgi:hypothetical protein